MGMLFYSIIFNDIFVRFCFFYCNFGFVGLRVLVVIVKRFLLVD